MSIYIKGMEMPDRCFACPMCDTDCCGVSKGSYIEYRDVDVDVAMDGRPDWCPLVPVPEHGRWKLEENWETGYGVYVHVCTACNAITPVNVSRYKYCPNCGAKMDEEDE